MSFDNSHGAIEEMEIGPSLGQPLKAENACLVCSHLKRKCSRDIPSCLLCTRRGKVCQYAGRPGVYSQDTATTLQTPSYESSFSVEPLLRTKSSSASSAANSPKPGWPSSAATFPALYFLDPEDKTQLPRDVTGQNAPSREVLEVLGSRDDVRLLRSAYFLRVQNWLPILSEKRMIDRLDRASQETNADLSLLVLCMKLLVEPMADVSPYSARSTLYYMAKELFMKLECFEHISLEMLQAMILVAVYEMGHGIYPNAYLSISHAARIAIIMGLHDKKNAKQLFTQPGMWTIGEEERRAWWAIVILDRMVNLGISNLPFATPDPRQGDLLPCTDTRWKQGELGFNEPLFASSFLDTTQIGSFANTCQSAHIVGMVIRHRNEQDNQLGRHAQFVEATKLHQTLVALESHLLERTTAEVEENRGSSAVALALCAAGRVLLYGLYGCNEVYAADQPRIPEERAMQQIALKGLNESVQTVSHLARHILTYATEGDMGVSPLICHTLYLAVGECAWLAREEGGSERVGTMQAIVDLLALLGQKWQVAKIYVESLSRDGDLALLS